MYSMVLLMALTSSPSTPTLQPFVDDGSYPVAVRSGDLSEGQKLYRHKRGGGCCGCSGGHGCSGYAASCGCHGYAMACGCHGYAMGCGCYGGHVYAPVVSSGCPTCGLASAPVVSSGCPTCGPASAPAAAPPREMPRKGAFLEGTDTHEATIVVHLPADARLTIDGEATRSTSDTRTFVTPPLQPDQEFSYTLKAETNQDGQTVATTRQVMVRAGQETTVDLDFPQTTALSQR